MFNTRSSRPDSPSPCRRWCPAIWITVCALHGNLSPANAAIAWQTSPGYRVAPLDRPAGDKPGFTAKSPALTGIGFTNRLAEDRSIANQVLLNGSGLAAGDVDGDGRCDLYFCGLDSPNALYRNLGRWRFENTARTAGVECADQSSTGAVLVDLDGDEDLDLLVSGLYRGIRLFLNDGQGRFTEATDASGLKSSRGTTSIAVADVDGDGDLDVYAVNYRNDTMRDLPDMRFQFGVTNGVSVLLSVNGRPAGSPDLEGRFSFDRASGVLENGEPDTLFLNDGQARFTPVPWTRGAFLDADGKNSAVPYDWGLSAMFRDFNGDGAPDLYVCNDFQSPDRFWLNDGHGRFRAAGPGVLRQTSLFSMGVDAADIDRDGRLDFFVADMLSPDRILRQVQVMDGTAFAQFRHHLGERPQQPRNTLFRQRGTGTFAEVAQFAGLEASDWSWCPVFLDVDLDGYEDLLVTTGHWRDAQNVDVAREIDEARKQRRLSKPEELQLRRRFPKLDTPNHAYRNRGDWTFEGMDTAWGFDSRRISHGMALADLDGDGDQDVIINCLNDAPLIYENLTPRPRVAVRLRGAAKNTRGLGANITVRAPHLPEQSQEIIAGGRYLSSDDPARTFAVARGSDVVSIVVTWRSGARTTLANIPANSLVEIEEPASASAPAVVKTPAPRFFEDASHRLNHTHHDEPFDDFARQSLLPRKFSESGPGLAWFDFNGDGWDDLVMGGGRGGRLAVFRNDTQGGFVPQKARLLESPLEQDVTSVLGWRPGPADIRLLLGISTGEAGLPHPPALREISLTSGEIKDTPAWNAADTGPLALADVDGDGDLDLFVGGRVIPGRFPEAASSTLFLNDGGRFVPDAAAAPLLERIGMVTGGIFTDLNADGWPDLVVACEWGPVRIFLNRRGTFTAIDPEVNMPDTGAAVRLSTLTGGWTSLAAGDFDNDGRLDLLVGNWGLNSGRKPTIQHPLLAHAGGPDARGGLAVIESRFDAETGAYHPARDLGSLGDAFPMLRARFPTYAAFSTVSTDTLLASGLPRMEPVKIAMLASILLLNRGETFDLHPLPLEAQLSPVTSIAVGDLDGDGNEDALLAQNIFGVASNESRQDAGCGVWLRGDGKGMFTSVPPETSGIEILGEGRGTALCDFNQDGRLDLAVGQARGATKLYRNQLGQPGLRIRLEGAGANPQAIGAQVRLKYKSGRLGPVHELPGGGNGSQGGQEMVLGRAEAVEAVEIRWPGGERQVLDPGDSRVLEAKQAR